MLEKEWIFNEYKTKSFTTGLSKGAKYFYLHIPKQSPVGVL